MQLFKRPPLFGPANPTTGSSGGGARHQYGKRIIPAFRRETRLPAASIPRATSTGRSTSCSSIRSGVLFGNNWHIEIFSVDRRGHTESSGLYYYRQERRGALSHQFFLSRGRQVFSRT